MFCWTNLFESELECWIDCFGCCVVLLTLVVLLMMIPFGNTQPTLHPLQEEVSLKSNEHGAETTVLQPEFPLTIQKSLIVDLVSKETQTIEVEVANYRKGKRIPTTNMANKETQTFPKSDENDIFVESLMVRLEYLVWDNSILDVNNEELKRCIYQREKDMLRMTKEYATEIQELDEDIEQMAQENDDLRAENKVVKENNAILADCIKLISIALGSEHVGTSWGDDEEKDDESTEKEDEDDANSFSEDEGSEIELSSEPNALLSILCEDDADKLIDELYSGYEAEYVF